MSFAYPQGLPREADVVFDARYSCVIPITIPIYGLEPGLMRLSLPSSSRTLIFEQYFNQIRSMLELLLPRFVQEGKKYVTIAVGCTGGRHRSVHIVEKLAAVLQAGRWAGLDMQPGQVTVAHRELQKSGIVQAPRQTATSFQAQEA